MSGGHFNYHDYYIRGIADQISEEIERNDERGLTEETLAEFRKAIRLLHEAQTYVHRIDWLLSGDDGEDNFHKRLTRDLAQLKEEQR